MYCDFAGCNCIVCDQIEGACQDCELRDPYRSLIDHVYDSESLMDEVKDMIEEKRAAEVPLTCCKSCFHYDVCIDYTNLKNSEFAQNYDQSYISCDHFVFKGFVSVMKNDKFLKMKSSMKIVKNTTDGILGVVNRIAQAEQISDWNELYEFILNLDPETFCNYQLAPVSSAELPDALPEGEEI